jgi:hypothetical protein
VYPQELTESYSLTSENARCTQPPPSSDAGTACSLYSLDNLNECGGWSVSTDSRATWNPVTLPDIDWGCENCTRYYRASIVGVPRDFQVRFTSDNKARMRVNGQLVFDQFWLANYCTDQPCCSKCCDSYADCLTHLSQPYSVSTSAFTNGTNVIEWEVYQETGASGFNAELSGTSMPGATDAGEEDDAGSSLDAGSTDARRPTDASAADSGRFIDAGAREAGRLFDASAGDAGRFPDAGQPTDAGSCCVFPNRWWKMLWTNCAGQQGWSFTCAQRVTVVPSTNPYCPAGSVLWQVDGVTADTNSCSEKSIAVQAATPLDAVNNGCGCSRNACESDCQGLGVPK